MIAVDTNILVYAHRSDSQFHERAAEALLSLAIGNKPWALPWPCVHEFLAVVTRLGLYDPPTQVETALMQVEAWVAAPSVKLLGETSNYLDVLARLIRRSAVTGLRVHDARIAAICIANGVSEFWTSDRDFHRFPLTIKNPVAEEK